jgi:predicted PurR-regulated permease PerM
MKSRRIEISYKTIVFIALFLISLVLLWKIRNIILLLFISFVFMEAINPTITRLEKLKVPRALAIIFLYIIILLAIGFALSGIVPVLIEQTTALINALPNIIENTKIMGTSAIDFSSQFKILENVPSNIAGLAISVVSNIFQALIIFFITFYLLIEKKNFERHSHVFFGDKGSEKFLKIIDLLEVRLGNWVSAELFLMFTIGILSYLGYLVLGLKYSVPLAIFAGLMEAVPTIGPTISTIAAGLVGLTISPITALFAIIWGVIVQQLENNFIVPKVMNKTVGFNPLITILAISIGAELAGVVGAILALPIFLTVEVVYKVLRNKV